MKLFPPYVFMLSTEPTLTFLVLLLLLLLLLLPYLLTPWCSFLLEKLTGLQLVKKFLAFHGTRRFITALTSVRHLSLSWASPIQSIYPHPTSWRSILILFTHLLSTYLRLYLPIGLFTPGFPSKTHYYYYCPKVCFYLFICLSHKNKSTGVWHTTDCKHTFTIATPNGCLISRLYFVVLLHFVTFFICSTAATWVLSKFDGNTENLNRRRGGLSENCTKLKYVSWSADVRLFKYWCSNLVLKREWPPVQFYVLCRQSFISHNVHEFWI